MTRLRRRVESLEARNGQNSVRRWHTVQVEVGESEDDALVRYGQPISDEEGTIFLKMVSPRFNAAGDMIFYADWPENDGKSA